MNKYKYSFFSFDGEVSIENIMQCVSDEHACEVAELEKDTIMVEHCESGRLLWLAKPMLVLYNSTTTDLPGKYVIREWWHDSKRNLVPNKEPLFMSVDLYDCVEKLHAMNTIDLKRDPEDDRVIISKFIQY